MNTKCTEIACKFVNIYIYTHILYVYANERKLNGHECTLEKYERKMKGNKDKLKDNERKMTGNACKMKGT